MRKLFVSLIILLVFAGAVFYIGWVQFAVPIGSYGVMLSKTSGVYPKPIVYGDFLWKWERLLPTNTQLRIFSLDPINLTDTFSSTLPSAQLYSTKLEGEPDFSYTLTVSSTAQVKKDSLVKLVQEQNLGNQEDLEALVRENLHQFNIAVTSYLLEQTQNDTTGLKAQTITTKELVQETNLAQQWPWMEIVSTEVSDIKIPDTSLYIAAKNAYLNGIIEGTGEKITESNHLSALVNLGEILTKYPVLSDYMTSGNVVDTLELLTKENMAESLGLSEINSQKQSPQKGQEKATTEETSQSEVSE